MRRKIILRVALIIVLIIAIASVGFVVWASNPAQPMQEAIAALESDTDVSVNSENWIVFTPINAEPTTGIIFYPGGLVDARAYAPTMHEIAQRGDYLAVIVPMPLNLAVFGIGRASEVIAAYPSIEHWVIAGHSLGGAMAANFVRSNPDAVDGISLWASYPASSDDLSLLDVIVYSVYGTNDGLASVEDVENGRALLPENASYIAIEGGNHAQFGWYGDQNGDNPATITRETQQLQLIDSMLDLLGRVES